VAVFNLGSVAGPIRAIAGAALLVVSGWYAVMAMTDIHGDVLFASGIALWLATLG
jgi:hypothetical protein